MAKRPVRGQGCSCAAPADRWRATMALHRATPTRHRGSHQVNPLAVLDSPELGEGLVLPTTRLSDNPMPPETAYQLIHDELMLDGNARLNLATFVTTWMEEPAARLMTECAEKN